MPVHKHIRRKFRIIFSVVLMFFALCFTRCYDDECYDIYSNELEKINLNVVDNSGNKPIKFSGNSLRAAVYGISYQQEFSSYTEECYFGPYNIATIRIFTKNRFNNTYKAGSEMTTRFKYLPTDASLPVLLTSNTAISQNNYLLLNEIPDKDTIQQFIIYTYDRYNTLLSTDITNPITLIR